jgi:DNA (cytosine-5)-methyltransferase 1
VPKRGDRMDAVLRPFEADEALARKMRRLAAGNAPRVLDLFSGCGGLSLGFLSAGFSIAAAMELDPIAARSHARNFHGADVSGFEHHAKPRDVTQTEPADLCAELGLGSVEESIDIIVGGPPCQAYARVGRAKLREVAEHPEAFRIDPRGNLYLRYLAYVRAFRPLALLMENVPDIMHYGGHNVVQEIVETLDAMGYDARYSLINAAFHGVPQMRDRVFLIAYRRELGITPSFPRATNHMTLPAGYAGTRAVALRYVDLLGGSGYAQADLGGPSLPFAVTASEAIGDLPAIRGDSVRRGARRFGPDTFMPYRTTNEISPYAALMRQWPGFESQHGVIDHAIRFLPRDGAIFAAMPEGAEYPEAHRVAQRLFEAEAAQRGITRRMKAWAELVRDMVPPYDPTKFPNRWWKLRRDYPVRTLMAHIGKDTYSHIHWDRTQARTISVREAARLQSFPDGFQFEGTMNPAFRQIGNAVPPLMAKALADVMYASLGRTAARLPQAVWVS